MKKMNKLIDDLKKFKALPPYNTYCNTCAYDGYFWKSIKGKYTEAEIKRAERHIDMGIRYAKMKETFGKTMEQ